MEWGEVFIAVSTEKFYVTHGLRTAILNGEAAVRILDIVSCGYNIICYLKKIFIVSTIRTFESVRNFGF